MHRRYSLFLLAIGMILAFSGSPKPALAILLTNGPGDGTLSVEVDEFGSFGSAIDGFGTGNLFYDPVGPQGPAGTTFESGIAFRERAPAGFFGPRRFLTSGDIGGTSFGSVSSPIVSVDSRTATSSFNFGSFSFDLVQTLIDSLEGGSQVGTILDQRYTITNNAVPVPAGPGGLPGEDAVRSFEIVRYLDGDLRFDGTNQDGGGVLGLGGAIGGSDNIILFETDAASGAAASTTFVGITGIGGTGVGDGRFEIGEFSDLRSQVINGTPLGNTTGEDDSGFAFDTDGDGFIDDAFDVTLALRNLFVDLAPGLSTTYRTQTLLGNAVPPAPGSSEALPLLPANDAPPFIFDISVTDPAMPIWIDPPIAVGYEYEVTSGPNVASVQMPTGVQPGAFEILTFNGMDFVSQGFVDPGNVFTFGAGGVSLFQIAGIDPALGLDPSNPLAFPAGLTFVAAGNVTLTMTPLLAGEVTTSVPEPSTLGLMIVGFVILIGFARPRRRAA